MQELSLNTVLRTARLFNKGLKDSVQTYVTKIAFLGVLPCEPSHVLSDSLSLSLTFVLCVDSVLTRLSSKHFDTKVFTSHVQH